MPFLFNSKRIPDSILHRFRAIILLCCFAVSAFTVAGKAILYEGRDGLSSNDISVIAKDNRGLMWIGTYNGLNTYDGYTFTKLKGALSNLNITSLLVNNAGNEILAGTKAGLFSVNLTTLQITKIEREKHVSGIWYSSKVGDICTHPLTKEVYVSFAGGYIGKLNRQHKLELLCRLNDTSRNTSSLMPGAGYNLIANNGDIYTIDVKQKTAALISSLKNSAPYNSISVSGNTLLLNGYYSKFRMMDLTTFQEKGPDIANLLKKYSLNRVLQSQLKNNKLYILSGNYTFIVVDIAKGTVNEISKKYPDIFEGRAYYSLYIDDHDIIWIATNKGLIKVEERPELFTKELSNLPSRVSTRSIVEDVTGDIYVASYIGLWHYSQQNKTWTRYNLNTPEAINSNPLAEKQSVEPLALLNIPNSSYLYLGYDSDKLLRFDKKKKVFERIIYTTENAGDEALGMYSLFEDKNGTLWIGCGNGLASYDPARGKLTMHHNDAFDIGKDRVRYILDNPKNKNILYVASMSGLFVLDINKGVTRHFNQTTRPALTNNDVLYVGQDKNQRLWLGTNGGGINIISADMKSVQSIHKQDGLSSEVVYTMIAQDDNTYWIGTFNGLDLFREDKKSFSNFFEEDGLSSNEFNQNSFLKTSDGKMYFGSINGVTSFYPQLFHHPPPFKIYLSGISKWDENTQTVQLVRENLSSSKRLIKKPSDLLFELHFACTDYSDPLRNNYSYRIKEISENWFSLEDRHTLNLGGIPYGNYILEVKAVNSRGVSSSNVLTFEILVSQPFYKTWWFLGLILTGIAMIFYVAYLIKYQSFKNILHLRMKIASNLHDEVGSLLTRITMFSDNLRYSKNSEEQRNLKLEKIAVLSRNAVASMSDVLWTIDSRNDFAGNLLDRMREHTEEMLFPLGIDVNFVLSGTDLKQHISSDMRGEIYLIFKEAVNNIVKHSQASRVDIRYQVNDKNFLLRITNNGAKEDISDISTGQGLSNMKMRAAKTGAEIDVKKEGELFTVEIKN